MTERIFGASGAQVIIEEFLEGEEVSLLAFCDGKTGIPMLPVQDHKRIGAGDTGPNTGGMGTYTPTTVFTETVAAQVTNGILMPTLQAMEAEGVPFVGILFLGLMITKDGPKVIEYNARFGDPETQVVLPLLDADLVQIFLKSIAGELTPDLVKWRPKTTAVCVVAASSGYPGQYPTGCVITGLDQVTDDQDSLIFHAGTKRTDCGDLVTSGGRVLNVVHLGTDIENAVNGAYRDLQLIHFDGMYYRPDIGQRELDADSSRIYRRSEEYVKLEAEQLVIYNSKLNNSIHVNIIRRWMGYEKPANCNHSFNYNFIGHWNGRVY